MRGAYFVIIAVLAASTGGLARAEDAPKRIVWATFVRAGPGHNFGTIDEIDRGVSVGVLGCADRWCAITHEGVLGYIEQDALALPALPNGQAPIGGPEGCFQASAAGWSRPVPQVFCQTKPK